MKSIAIIINTATRRRHHRAAARLLPPAVFTTLLATLLAMLPARAADIAVADGQDITATQTLAAGNHTITAAAGVTGTISGALNSAGVVAKVGAGTVYLTGGGAISAALQVNGGHLIINSGTLDDNSSTLATIGTAVGDHGTLTITGAGSFYRKNRYLVVGASGTGIINVLDGALAQADRGLTIGQSAGSFGTVNIDGPGSYFRVGPYTGGGALTFNNGVLNIINGGSMTTDTGASIMQKATINIDGAGSILDSAGEWRIGNITDANTNINVTNGGVFTTAGNIIVGYYASAAAANNVLVGAGARFGSSAGNVVIGNAASAAYTLAGSGTVFGAAITIQNNVNILPGDTAGAIGVLSLAGNTTLNGAILHIDTAAGGDSDRLDIAGNLVLGATANIIQIDSWVSGTYNILTSSAAIPAITGKLDTVTDAGAAIGARQSANVSLLGTGTVQLVLSEKLNYRTAWTNAAGNRVWNVTAQNWQALASAAVTDFAAGDYVIFDAAGAGAEPVTIDGNVTVSGMEITAGDYTFDGGQILTTLNTGGADITAPSGKLIKDGAGLLAFANTANNFAGGIELRSGSLAFTRGAQLGARDASNADHGLTVTGNATLRAGADTTVTTRLNLAAATTLTLDTQAHTIAWNADITAAPGAAATTLTKTGAGTLAPGGALALATLNLDAGSLAAPAGAVWDVASFNNNAALKIGRAAGAATHGTLTLNGDYTGAGTLHLGIDVAGGVVNIDRLVITGDAAGSTQIIFQQTPDPAPLPANIELPSDFITVNGTAAAGAFIQGAPLVFGGSEYTWTYDATGAVAWAYPFVIPEALAITGMDASSILIGKAAFAALSNRLVAARDTRDPARRWQIWFNGLQRHDTLTTGLYNRAKADTYGVQAGADYTTQTAAGAALTLGLALDHAATDMDIPRNRVSTSAEARAASLYGSWRLGPWYAAAIARAGFDENYTIKPFNDTSRQYTTVPPPPDFETKGASLGGSLEIGCVLLDRQTKWNVEPQIQFIYQRHTIDDAADPYGRVYKIDSADSFEARAGVRVWKTYRWRGAPCFTPWFRGTYSHELKGHTRVLAVDRRVDADLGGSTGAGELGVSLQLGRGFSLALQAGFFIGETANGHNATLGASLAW